MMIAKQAARPERLGRAFALFLIVGLWAGSVATAQQDSEKKTDAKFLENKDVVKIFEDQDAKQEPKSEPRRIVLDECLLIGSVGSGGRSAVHTDAIEASIVAGKWQAPEYGDVVKLPEGKTEKWGRAKADEQGWFKYNSELSVSDIGMWDMFQWGLMRQAREDKPSPGKRILELLPESARALLDAARTERKPLDDEGKKAFVAALNELMKRKDFYNEEAFKDIEIPDRIRRYITRDPAQLSEQAAVWTNTYLLTAAFPDAISKIRGSYAFMTYQAEKPEIMILDARGHSMVYVNGVPRTGDPYSNGRLWLPVQLQAGKNEFLFRYGREQLRAELIEPRSPAMLLMGECTAPDFIIGEDGRSWASVLVINASTEPLTGALLRVEAGAEADEKTAKALETIETTLPTIPPLSVRKVAFEVGASSLAEPGKAPLKLTLSQVAGGSIVERDTGDLTLRVCKPEQTHSRTFISQIDGSVQYYATTPAIPPTEPNAPTPGLVLSLHGASVEATSQAPCYAPKNWVHIVAPTNRRPYGFDWEDWGRLDAMEVLDLNLKRLGTDPQRTYLTGHSMGGHGTWHVGLTYPDRFAAIGPSAGWASFVTYGGARDEKPESAMEAMLRRPMLQSDTYSSLSLNTKHNAVYILHGADDSTVPVREARGMRDRLATFHRDLLYHEQPGAGHWWDASQEPGTDCVDWAPMFDLFDRRRIPTNDSVRDVEFYTACPGISASSRWATIEAQIRDLEISSVKLRCNPDIRVFQGSTENVSRLSLDVAQLAPGAALSVELDGQKIEGIAWPEGEARIWFQRSDGRWERIAKPSPALKGPHRYGLFKDAFRHRFMLVYGTKGSPRENAWAFARARYDNEEFMCRGNASVDMLADVDFDAAQHPDRSVILYGNAETNAAWAGLLGPSPVQVGNGLVRVGEREMKGEDLACFFIRPRLDSGVASVGVIGGSGLKGMQLTDRMRIFGSGGGYPDCLIVSPKMLEKDAEGVQVAGFFGNDWSVEKGDFVWWDDPKASAASQDGVLTVNGMRMPPDLPRGYRALRAAKPIDVDGKIEEDAWANAPWGEYHQDIEGHKKPEPRFQTRMKMLWDNEYLYVAAELKDPHVWATVTERNAVIFNDNDFEVFIDPDGDRENYFEFEMNAFNTVWNLFLNRTYRDGNQAVVREMPGQKTGVAVQGTINDPSDTDTGWTLEIAFPWSAMAEHAGLPTPPRTGDQWRINFSRVEWETTIKDGKYVKVPNKKEDNWIWSPQGYVDMHMPETWGYVEFSPLTSAEAAGKPDPSAPARQVLRHIHFQEKMFHRREGRYASDLAELGLASIGHPTIVSPIQIIAGDDDFTISAEVAEPGAAPQWLSIGLDARFVAGKASPPPVEAYLQRVPTQYHKRIRGALARAAANAAELQAALEKAPEGQVEAVAFLVANMPQRDLDELNAEFLLENVEYAYKAREAVPWGKDIPDEIFLNDVVPYASVNERRDRWRKDFFEIVMPLVADCKTAGEAAVAVNDKLFRKVNVRYHATRRPKPDQSPYESIEANYASCTGLSVLLVDGCRAVCVPARIAGIPRWPPPKDGNHTWTEAWDRNWYCLGSAEGGTLNSGWFLGPASEARENNPFYSVYASSFRETDTHFPLIWDMNIRYVSAQNVSKFYNGRTTTEIVVLDRPGGVEIEATVALRLRGTLYAQAKSVAAHGAAPLQLILPKNETFEVEIVPPQGETVRTTLTTSDQDTEKHALALSE